MQNVECKYELRDPELCRSVIARLGAKAVLTIRQTDTYYKVPDGRLKRRDVPGEPTEWIFYHRQNRMKARLSHFQIYSQAEAEAKFGTRPLPVWVIVEKTREIWLMGEIRLHLDEVEKLGRFFEVEALVTPRRHVGICHEEVNRIIEQLGPVLGEPISMSYSDMLAAEME